MCPESATCLSGWGLSHASPERLPEAPQLGKPNNDLGEVGSWRETPSQARLQYPSCPGTWLAKNRGGGSGESVWHTGTEAIPGGPNKESAPHPDPGSLLSAKRFHGDIGTATLQTWWVICSLTWQDERYHRGLFPVLCTLDQSRVWSQVRSVNSRGPGELGAGKPACREPLETT